MLDRGMGNRDIGAELGISEHTVKVHLYRLFKHLGVHSRTQALHYLRTNGLLNSPFTRTQGKPMNNVQSPRTDDEGVEKSLQAKGKTAPRITPADIAANIVDTEIVKHVARSGQVLRWAVLTVQNGFAVTGRPSAAVSAENDDAEIGVATAIENSRNELWALMGYELKQRIYEGRAA